MDGYVEQKNCKHVTFIHVTLYYILEQVMIRIDVNDETEFMELCLFV